MPQAILAGQVAGKVSSSGLPAGIQPCVRLLGRRRLGTGTHPVQLQYRKGWALLAYLAVERRAHPRARLAAMFWPGLAPAAALTNLRQVLADLRRAMAEAAGPQALRVDREAVALDAAVAADVDLLELPVEAGASTLRAARWLAEAGQLLEGLALDGCHEFERWLSGVRAWLARRVEQAQACLRDAAARCGERTLALQLARQLARQDPWNEAHHLALMQLYLGRSGCGAGLLPRPGPAPAQRPGRGALAGAARAGRAGARVGGAPRGGRGALAPGPHHHGAGYGLGLHARRRSVAVVEALCHGACHGFGRGADDVGPPRVGDQLPFHLLGAHRECRVKCAWADSADAR